jgi:hypothetical protein
LPHPYELSAIGREKAEIDKKVGVRQGDTVSLVIFLFLMSAFVETLETQSKQSDLPEAIFSKQRASHRTSEG